MKDFKLDQLTDFILAVQEQTKNRLEAHLREGCTNEQNMPVFEVRMSDCRMQLPPTPATLAIISKAIAEVDKSCRTELETGLQKMASEVANVVIDMLSSDKTSKEASDSLDKILDMLIGGLEEVHKRGDDSLKATPEYTKAVDDVVAEILSSVNKDSKGPQTINVAVPKGVAVEDIIAKIEEAVGSKVSNGIFDLKEAISRLLDYFTTNDSQDASGQYRSELILACNCVANGHNYGPATSILYTLLYNQCDCYLEQWSEVGEPWPAALVDMAGIMQVIQRRGDSYRREQDEKNPYNKKAREEKKPYNKKAREVKE